MGSPCVSQVVPELSVYLRMTLTPDLLGSLSPVLELRVCPSPLCSADFPILFALHKWDPVDCLLRLCP